MKVLFDTSVLVAAILTGHSRYSVCLPQLLEAQSQQTQGLICTHTLAELYSALTRIPQTKISSAIAQNLIRDNLQTFECISLTPEDYAEAIEIMVQHQLPGGGIFDALIAQATLKSYADILLTLNPKHFTRLGSVIASKVQVPQ